MRWASFSVLQSTFVLVGMLAMQGKSSGAEYSETTTMLFSDHFRMVSQNLSLSNVLEKYG
jgi:hypothetical protein